MRPSSALSSHDAPADSLVVQPNFETNNVDIFLNGSVGVAILTTREVIELVMRLHSAIAELAERKGL